MKKKTKRLIVVAVLLVLVIVLLLVVTNLMKESETGSKEQNAVSQTAVKDIEGITYTSESTSGEAVTLIRENNIWYYANDKEFPLDQEYVTNNMVLTAAEATANKTVENPGENLADYGLDKPTVTITLKKITGDEVKMSIGSYNESVEGYYLKVEGDDNIYLVDGQMAFSFDMSIYDIADKEDYPYVEEGSFVHVKVEKNGQTVEFKGEVEENAPSYITDDYYLEKEKTWKISKNGASYKEGNQQSIKELITQLAILDYSRMIDYHADENEMKAFGIDEDSIVLTVDYQVLDETTAREVEGADGIVEIVCDTLDKQYTLRIGDAVPEDGFRDPEYYVSLEGSDVVYTMTEDSISAILGMNAKNYE